MNFRVFLFETAFRRAPDWFIVGLRGCVFQGGQWEHPLSSLVKLSEKGSSKDPSLIEWSKVKHLKHSACMCISEPHIGGQK